MNELYELADLSFQVQCFLDSIPRDQLAAARGLKILEDYEFDKCLPIGYSDCEPTKTILDSIRAKGNLWILKSLRATVKITREKFDVFRLVHKHTGTYCDFTLSGKEAYVLIFQVAREAESKYWVARRNFVEFFQVMMLSGIDKIFGQTPKDPDKIPIARPEWRDKKVTDGNGRTISKLQKFWNRMGAIEFDDRLIILSPALAFITKEHYKQHCLGNPYRFLARSVYGRDVERDLKKV